MKAARRASCDARNLLGAGGEALEARVGRTPEFVVVGTGRCGTTYVSKALTTLGVPCGHESFYGPAGFRRRYRLVGDVSWLAVPSLGSLGVPSYHVVREPLAVINSFLAIGFFRLDPDDPAGTDAHAPYRRFAQQTFTFSGEEERDAIRWYLDWNQRCEQHTRLRFQIEDPRPGLRQILRDLHRDLDEPALEDRLAALPTNVNDLRSIKDATHAPRRVERSALPDIAEVAELDAMSQRYGYGPL